MNLRRHREMPAASACERPFAEPASGREPAAGQAIAGHNPVECDYKSRDPPGPIRNVLHHQKIATPLEVGIYYFCHSQASLPF